MNEKPESALRSVPSWLSWVQWISWFRYGNELLLINQWRGMEIDCVPDYEGCIVTNGDEILETVGFSEVKLKWNKRSQQQFQMCLVFFFSEQIWFRFRNARGPLLCVPNSRVLCNSLPIKEEGEMMYDTVLYVCLFARFLRK